MSVGASSAGRAGCVVWLTGLPCSGKSTLATAVAEELRRAGVACEVLDGDELRRQLSPELGYSREDRDQNVRRLGFVASLLERHGVVAIVAAVSPYRAARDEVRGSVQRFIEVHVACPLEVCERRDVKGMYAEARAGRRAHFTGVDDPYEAPLHAEVRVATDNEGVAESTARIIEALGRG